MREGLIAGVVISFLGAISYLWFRDYAIFIIVLGFLVFGIASIVGGKRN